LDLLTHLLNGDLHVDRAKGGLNRDGLRRQGVGFSIELLHQKVQTPPDGPAVFKATLNFVYMGINSFDFLINIGFAGE
tara:strand:+ start:30173 stop:30406 length:234 start_codon:yes stop_codon:yes gene_type:complete